VTQGQCLLPGSPIALLATPRHWKRTRRWRRHTRPRGGATLWGPFVTGSGTDGWSSHQPWLAAVTDASSQEFSGKSPLSRPRWFDPFMAMLGERFPAISDHWRARSMPCTGPNEFLHTPYARAQRLPGAGRRGTLSTGSEGKIDTDALCR
jgi:hypothetical protein